MTPPEIDRLLTDDAWLRRLARSLTRDAALAEDLVQDTWVAALTNPAAARSQRGWLSGTLRNLLRQNARTEGRRSAREERAAQPEATAPTDEMLAELSLRRCVVDALLELDEPYRTVVFQRFFKGASLKRIAAVQGVSVSTAHARLERGLERMRSRLDAEHDGDRRVWAMGLLSIAGPTLGVGGTVTGGFAMGTVAKVGVATVVVASTVGWWFETRAEETPDDLVAAGATTEQVQDAPPHRGETPQSAAPASAARQAIEGERPAASGLPKETVSVAGRLVDLQGYQLGGVPIEFVSEATGVERSMRSAVDGSFSTEVPLGTPLNFEAFRIEHPSHQLVLASHEHDYGDPTASLTLVAGPRLRFEGLVVTPTGDPIPAATVIVRLRHSLYRSLGLKHDLDNDAERWKVESDADGRFVLVDGVGGEHTLLQVSKLAYDDARRDLPPYDETGITITLTPLDHVRHVTGRVLDPSGQPLSGASVSLGDEIVESDGDGGFRLKWDPERLRNQDMARGADGVWRHANRETHVAAVAQGFGPARVELTDEVAQELIVLQLGRTPLALTGRVVDSGGEPLHGIQVWLRDPTHFGRVTQTAGESIARTNVTLEAHLGGSRGTLSDANGQFRLAGLVARDYDVQIYDPRTATYGEGWTIAAGTSSIVLRLGDDPSTAPVSGRLVSASGAPHVGLHIRPVRTLAHGYDGQPPQDWSAALETDEDGRFEFAALALEKTQLELVGEGVFYQYVDLAQYPDPRNLELVIPLSSELQVTLQDPAAATELQVLDRDGTPLDLYVHQGAFISMTDTAKLTDGKSSVLEVGEHGTTLVLLRDGDEVGRLPIVLDPEQRLDVEY